MISLLFYGVPQGGSNPCYRREKAARMPETPLRATPFDKALLSNAEGLRTGLGGLIPAYTADIFEINEANNSSPTRQIQPCQTSCY